VNGRIDHANLSTLQAVALATPGGNNSERLESQTPWPDAVTDPAKRVGWGWCRVSEAGGHMLVVSPRIEPPMAPRVEADS
jgi:hypothetical protein